MVHVLIVDDESKIRSMYRRILKATGWKIFKITESSNAEDASMELFRQEYDLVLLDLCMPGINGRQMFDVIREYNARIKIIVASVLPIEEQKRILPSADGYYDKSKGPLKFLEKVTNSFTFA